MKNKEVGIKCRSKETLILQKYLFKEKNIAVRLHHRLVFIHPFPNGNGRLSRFYADLALTRHFGLNRLTWGGGELDGGDPRRQDYIAALQAADDHDYRS